MNIALMKSPRGVDRTTSEGGEADGGSTMREQPAHHTRLERILAVPLADDTMRSFNSEVSVRCAAE